MATHEHFASLYVFVFCTIIIYEIMPKLVFDMLLHLFFLISSVLFGTYGNRIEFTNTDEIMPKLVFNMLLHLLLDQSSTIR
jgi:hypothetical protein